MSTIRCRVSRPSARLRLLELMLAAVVATLATSCSGGGDDGGGSGASVSEEDRTATLGGLLVVAADVDFLSANGEAPMTETSPDEYYEERPTQICDDGDSAEMIARGDVFNLLDNDALIFFGQWISGEPADAAVERFAAGRDAMESCYGRAAAVDGDEVRYERWSIENPGIDELEGIEVVRNDRSYVHALYGRHGGLVTFMYFATSSAVWRPWSETERATVIEIALGKLLEGGRMTLPAPPRQVPGADLQTTTVPIEEGIADTIVDEEVLETIETVVELAPGSVATSTAPPTTPTSQSTPTATVDASLAARIPEVAGYDLQAARQVDWDAYQLPGGARAYAADVRHRGDVVGQLAVAGRLEANQLYDTYKRRLFQEPIEIDSGLTALARWESINGAAVITAKSVDADTGQWVWPHDGLFYVARGRLAVEQFVAALIGQQQQGAGIGSEGYEHVSGDLPDRLRDASPVAVYELPPTDALARMSETRGSACAEWFHAAYVPGADDPDPRTVDKRSLGIDILEISKACERTGFVENLAVELGAHPRLRSDVIAGHDVYRNNREIYFISGSTVVRFSARARATLDSHELVAGQIISGWAE